MKKFLWSFALLATLAFAFATGASAAGGYTLFGDAHIVSPGHNSAQAVEATSTAPGLFGGVDFSVPSGLTVSQLNNLATDYMFTLGTCGVGTPRFSVSVTNGTVSGNLFFYIGPPPSYTGCPPNVWTNSGNLASATNLVDSSQLGGTFYDPYAHVQAVYGSYTVTDIALVVDNSGPDQTVRFDNTQVNNTLYTYEPAPTKDDCKNGGWQNFTGNAGPFKNQGDCVSFFNNGK